MPDARFTAALLADQATPDYPERMKTFGQLVGEWAVANRFRAEAGDDWVESERRWLFSYVLDGRGVQDVIIGSDREGASDDTVFGTTLRVYDRTIGAWRVNYFSPHSGEYCALVASGYRDGVRQDGTQTDGRPIRWNFSAITPDSFEWDGWVSDDEGATWWQQQHMVATRLS